MHFKTRRPSAGTVVGTIALVFALTGAAVALPGKDTVNSGDIKNKQVKTVDLNKKTVAPRVKVQTARNDTGQNLPASSTVTAISKSVPAGKYAVSAKTNLFTNGDDSFSCAIMVGATEIDEARLNPESDVTSTRPISMLGVATVPAGTPLDVECSSASEAGSVDESVILAIPAG